MQNKTKFSWPEKILIALYDNRLSYRNISYYAKNYRWPDRLKNTFFNQYIYRLEERGLVEKRKTGPAIEIIITKKGIDFLNKRKREVISLKKPQKWDGKWRMVIFDIPEKQKTKRNSFRLYLKRLGFTQVQRSVWVVPYPCLNEVRKIVEDLGIVKYVTVMEGKYLGDDKKLKDHFNLN